MSIKIIGTGTALPQKQISNDDLSQFLETNDEWIISKTGIKTRYLCVDESLTDLSETASNMALKKAGLTAGDIDLIICATLSGDYTTPSLSCCVAERLGVSCPAFDLNAACTGFIYALETASLYLSSGKAKNILLVCADMMSKHVDWTNRKNCILFGDGAAACVLTSGNALRYLRLGTQPCTKPLTLNSHVGNSPYSQQQHSQEFLFMDGQEVFKFAVKTAEREIDAAMNALGIGSDDVRYFIMHQANKRIVDSIRTRTAQPEHKFPINVDRYGNMSSASVPFLIDELLGNGSITSGDTLLMCSFGAGLTYGTCIMAWE